MARIFYIEASPRKERSHSIHVAKHFLEAYREEHEEDEIEVLDLWHTDLPPFDGFTIEAKYAVMRKKSFTKEQKEAWDKVVELFTQFSQADKYVISTPMWNYSIPYKLKHYIDLITQPGLAFQSTKEGLKGSVTGKPAILVYASGGTYGEGPPTETKDFQKSYMRLWLQFIGFTEIREVVIDNTLAPIEKCKEHEQEVFQEAEALAHQL